MTQYLGKSVGITVRITSMKVYVHEDNAGELILARTFPQKYTPRSKYNTTRTIWFHKESNKKDY